ncbi:alpha-xylosidase [Thermicanus aegyptius]|uniref:alpha-xylosidase n=1 Tax=Thermicanus aegyptius TaxID=94009 RepID=UPI00041AF568|nr:alpha-xylosidase [Thermicanus aegyptius]
MKFTNGYWLVKEGIEIQYPMDLRDAEIKGKKLIVYAATRKIRHKGDTLNGALLSVEFSSPMPDVIRVRWAHHLGGQRKGPAFILHESADTPVQIENREERIVLTSGNLSVNLRKGDEWGIDFYYAGKRMTGTGNRGTAYITTQERSVYFREQLDLGVGEHIYGLGERFTPFVKNGQSVDIWNEDGGTSSEQAYKNVPFYLSSRGYGVFVNHPERVSFEVASENVSKVQFSIPGETLEYFVIGGATLKDVLKNYTALTGRPALPPAWSFGLWLTTSFTTDYDENTVKHFIEGMFERDIPLRVFHFDCFWMREYQWSDFEWDTRVFPDPEGMIRRLKEKGLKISVWINPYIAQKSPLFKEGMENGYLLKKPNGDVWQWDMWQAGMGVVDFTNPAAVKWYQGKLRRLLDMGVDCFKTDFGERIPTDVVYYDGSDPNKMHNFYTYLYNKAVFELLEEKVGKNEALVFARSATAGSQQFPVHWGGDSSSTYESMAESLRGGLSLGLSGFGFWSHDISGFEKTATPDLYKRWVAFGLLSSHSRLHGNVSYRVPWLFDEEAVDVLRHFTKLKYRLMPYLFAMAVEAAEKGIPMMRAMMLEFPDDPTCEYLDRQYMLGDGLLVAPIFREDGTVKYYVPEGRWTHFLTGETIQGSGWRTEKHNYFSLPVLVRPNTFLAIGADDHRPDYDYADQVTLKLYELEDGKKAKAVVYDVKGNIELEVAAERSGQTIAVESRGSGKPWKMVLAGIPRIQSAEGVNWESDGLNIVLQPFTHPSKFTVTVSS